MKKYKVGGIGDTGPNEPHKSLAMVAYDLVREDGRLERVCKHGIGHTVGHRNPGMLKKDWIWVHGCDGCCHDYPRMKP